MTKATLYGKGRSILNNALSKHEAFSTNGAFKATQHGDHKPYYHGGGSLSGEERDAWMMDRTSVTYVVWSYDTPIAWDTISADGSTHTHTVQQKFSTTTSRHQGTLYLL